MEKESRVDILQQFRIACMKPSLYKKLLDNKYRKWLFLPILIVMLVLIENIIPFAGWDASVGGLRNFVENRIPEFTLSAEGLKMESPVFIEREGVMRIVVDSDVAKYKKDDLESDYMEEILVSQSNLLLKNGKVLQEFSFSSLGSGVLTNKTITEMLPLIRFMLGVYAVILAVIKAVQYMFWTLCFAMICRSSVRSPQGDMVTFKEAFALSFYAKTLPAIACSINVCLGYKIDSMFAIMASVFLTMMFMYRAEFAILKERQLIN